MAQVASLCFNILIKKERQMRCNTQNANRRTAASPSEHRARPPSISITPCGQPKARVSFSWQLYPITGPLHISFPFLEWSSFHALCMTIAVSSFKTQLKCQLGDAIFDYQLDSSITFYLSPLFFSYPWSHFEIIECTLLFLLPILTTVLWRQGLSSLVDNYVSRADLGPWFIVRAQ